MDYILIGSYQFDRDASKDDMRLDYCSAFQEVALDESNLSFDTVSAEVYTKTVGEQLAALPDNTPIVIYRNNAIKARFVKRGVSRIGPNTYSLIGRSPMGALTGMIHSGGIYTGQTIDEVAKEICGSIPILVKTVYAETKLYGWLPYANGKDRSARDNLVQVLFAIGAYLRTDLNGVLRIEPLWDGAASTISVDRSYSGGTVKYDSPISAVTVTEHQYIAGTDEKELFSGTSQQGDIITFSEPMHSLAATGFTILESGANYAKISSGSGLLKGKTYIHNTRLVTQTVTENAVENVKSVTDATLVSLVNSSAVAKRLADYYKCRETITNGIVSGQEKPGHVVSVYHPYDKKMVSACIVSLDTTMSGTLKSEMAALVGYLPPQPEITEYYDDRVLLTGSGEWTVPEDVTSLRAVLIDQGADGTDGTDGADSNSVSFVVTSDVDTKGGTWSVQPSDGGLGGKGGLGGEGGRILSADLNVTPGIIFAYSVAEETTFGDLSSANGSRSDIGFTDPVTGDVYGKKGDDGVSGGNGGNGGRASGSAFEPGENGGDVLPYTGGLGDEGFYQRVPESSSAYIGGQLQVRGGSGGGGAAHGKNGNDATHISGQARTPGSGANAPLPVEAGNYGCGGNGGHGGGGAGGASGYYFSHGAYKYSGTSSGKLLTFPGGTGGTGSKGSFGKPGCIILYYRKKKELQPGPLVTSNNLGLLDSLGRRMIV
nr:MAG TPA: 43 kDa tail protein [Caudoviricetes sp.]